MGEFLVLITRKYPQMKNLLYEQFLVFITLLRMHHGRLSRPVGKGPLPDARPCPVIILNVALDNYSQWLPPVINCIAPLLAQHLRYIWVTGGWISPEARLTTVPEKGERQGRRGFLRQASPRNTIQARVEEALLSLASFSLSLGSLTNCGIRWNR